MINNSDFGGFIVSNNILKGKPIRYTFRADSIYEIAPVMLEIFEAPYGTDLCWLYEEGVHVGFYDLVKEREITIEEILSSPK